jgi:hypothetical protein
MDSSRRSLGARFRVRLRTGLRLCILIAAPSIAVHFAVDKLGEIDDEVLVLARSKPEVENDLHADRFYKRLHECVKQCRYVISSPFPRRKDNGRYVRGPKFYPYSR